jgi:hypothetical protein
VDAAVTARQTYASTARANGIGTGMTETCCWSAWSAGGTQTAIDWGRLIYMDLTQANNVDWEVYTLAGVCNTIACSGSQNGQPFAIAGDGSAYYRSPA